VCYGIFVRIDGCQATNPTQGLANPPVAACVGAFVSCDAQHVVNAGACVLRWQQYWQNPTPASNSESGMRGLTAVTVAGNGSLIVGGSGGLVSQYHVQAYPACVNTPTTCYAREYNNVTVFQSNISGINAGNMISPYNDWDLWYDSGHTGRRMAGQNV